MPSNHFPTLMQEYVHLSRYARWLPDEKRREMWPETVTRYFDFFEDHLIQNHKYNLSTDMRKTLEGAVLSQKVMPSMRAIMTAGEALKRDPIAGYNCAYIAIDSPRSFDETLYILMCGTGVGFSVEKKYVRSLPVIEEEFHDTDTTIVVADSKTGWAKSFKELIHLLYSGQVPRWDISRVRATGTPLKTFGGRASGPGPLEDLFRFTVRLFKNAAGRKLSSLECHDLVCKIAEIVVVGGVRRSALISLSDLDDRDMRDAKSGRWWETHPHRMLANNSYVAKEKDMNVGTFMEEWNSLYASKSGERGIFSRYAARNQAARNGRRNVEDHDFGCNPCSEIILRSRQFCNLTEVIIRSDDTEASLLAKVEAATIMGTFQSTLTDFRYISKKWKENCEEERLLGVSLTGIMDCALTNGKNGLEKTKKLLNKLRDKAVQVNKELTKELGINQSVAVTCVKPSGTVSSLVDSSAGIHTRHSQYYIRTVRGDKKDPLAFMMQDMEFPHEDCVTKPESVVVFSFPIKAPDGAVFRNEVNAIDQLELWKLYQDEWCEHKPSVTISVKEHEWMEVGAWTYKHFASISGISFLPFSDAEYKQMPYQDCTKEQYEDLLTKMPKQVYWTRLKDYEMYDTTTGTKEYACSADGCDIK